MSYKKCLGSGLYKCRNCGYTFRSFADLRFDEDELCPCCPDCGELIEDGDEYPEDEGLKKTA